MINVVAPSRYPVKRRLITSAAHTLLTKEGLGSYALNVVFVGKRKMKDIAHTYKQEDVALPVLSFRYKDEEHTDEKLLGEIFICYPQAILLAAERNKRVDDMLINLVIHGLENIIRTK